jgi:predicted lysophospholipase L1 biosynthesis ABC-type transport system permease subunit
MALRAALGAGRRRLVGQLLVESMLLGVAGGAIGLVLAFAGVDALLRLAPPNLPRLEEIRVDRVALLFNLAVSLGAALLFGLRPALRAARVDVHDALKQGGARGVLGSGRGGWVRGALVSAEVALALVLTLGAGLLFRSFLALHAVDLGYHTEGRLVLTVSIPAKTEAQHHRAGATFERIFAALRELPGVSAAAGVMGLPSGPYGSNGLYARRGCMSSSLTIATGSASYKSRSWKSRPAINASTRITRTTCTLSCAHKATSPPPLARRLPGSIPASR